MPSVKLSERVFKKRLKDILVSSLKEGGIDAAVKIEPVLLTKLHRVLVTARNFKDMSSSERQNLVWRILDGEFSPEEQLRISMILTLTPEELGQG